MGFVLHKLNLTADQKTQVKAIFADEKSQFEALRSERKANRKALATTPPTDPGYPALIQTRAEQCGDAHQARERDLDVDLSERADQGSAAGDPR